MAIGAQQETITYRLAHPRDRWALAMIEARSFGWGRLAGGQWLRLDGRKLGGWVAADALGRIRGYALIERRPREGELQPYVPGIGVDPAWRRRGIGEHLMRLLLGSHRGVWLHAREDNTPARRLYARLGMREAGHIARFYSDGAGAIIVAAD